MSELHVTLDLSQARTLIPDLRRGLDLAVHQATDRSVEVMRSEVRGGPESRLGKGITPEYSDEKYPIEGRIKAAAEVQREARTATVHLPSGQTKEVNLKGTDFDYAELEATGSGVHGPRGQFITPKQSKMLLIGVDSVPADSSYIDDGRQKYIVRPFSSGQLPNPYPDRTADKVETEVEGILEQALTAAGVTE